MVISHRRHAPRTLQNWFIASLKLVENPSENVNLFIVNLSPLLFYIGYLIYTNYIYFFSDLVFGEVAEWLKAAPC